MKTACCSVLNAFHGLQKWNGLLRQIPNLSGNRYTTTIHVLVSAVLKLSQTTKVPQGRRVYRGLGGMVLDDKWFRSDERNTRGGVELGFLSTTLNRSTALESSGVKKGRGIVLEIDVGAIDCGAQLDCLSQYPGGCPLKLVYF
jgi:NLR family CARD domain-containing protein 3